MAVNEIHTFDSQTVFEIYINTENDTLYSLTDVTLVEFRFQKPDGLLIVKDGSVTINGSVKCITTDEDLDQYGLWRYQVYIEKGPIKRYSNIGEFRVYPNLPLE